jgi:predicted esterase
MIVRTIAARAHGRYLVDVPDNAAPAPVLVGFHGYGEGADAELARLRAIAPDGDWLIVSVQSMHRFYRGRSQDVVASWMTTEDRELAIADNIAYANAVVGEVTHEWPSTGTLIFSGFSQGVAMAFRAATSASRPVSAAIVSGGDVPPEIGCDALARVPRIFISRGVRDDWYSAEKFRADIARLEQARVAITPLEFDGGHEWGQPLVDEASRFLRALR